MPYLLAAAAFIVVSVLAFKSASPARALAIAGAFGVAILAGLYMLANAPDREPPTIETSLLTLADARMSSDRYGHQLTGRVTNGSQRRLGTITLRVTYRDCPAEGECRVTGEESHEIFMALVPKLSGGFSIRLRESELAEKTGANWQVSIAAARADF